MKKIKLASLLVLFISALTFISCDNEPIDSNINLGDFNNGGNNPDPNTPAVGTFKVDFDGQTFVANVTQAIVNSDYIAITGLKTGTGEFFQITIPNGTVGTYTNANPTTIALAYAQGNGQDGFLGVSDQTGEFSGFPNYTDTAEVKINSINTTTNIISGTFKFTGVRFADATGDTVETKVFTNGSFSLSFAANNTSPSNNSFFAKLNGQDYNPTNVDGFKNSGMISLIGRRGAVENISLVVPDNIVPGTYAIEFGGDVTALYVMNSTGEGVFSGDPGTLTITSHNTSTKKIVGTFNFTGTSFFNTTTYEVTAGSFNITYQ